MILKSGCFAAMLDRVMNRRGGQLGGDVHQPISGDEKTVVRLAWWGKGAGNLQP